MECCGSGHGPGVRRVSIAQMGTHFQLILRGNVIDSSQCALNMSSSSSESLLVWIIL